MVFESYIALSINPAQAVWQPFHIHSFITKSGAPAEAAIRSPINSR